MTYSSRTFLISCGRGNLSRDRSCFSSSSSRMMSLQSSTHSSQTKTDGPAISLRTSCWLLPQKEQYSSLPSSCLPRVSSTMPHALVCRDTGCRLYSTPVSNGKILFQLNQLLALPAAESHQEA